MSPEGRRRQRQQQQQREQERRETGRDEPGGSERGRAGQTLNRQKEPVRHDMLDYAKHMGVPKMDLETDPAVHITEVRAEVVAGSEVVLVNQYVYP